MAGFRLVEIVDQGIAHRYPLLEVLSVTILSLPNY